MTEALTNRSNGIDPPTQGGHPFDVIIKSTGAVVRVGATQTVVEALQASGVLVPTSCQQGWCGTCLTAVLEGEIEHRDVYLSATEQAANDQFLPCCSRANSDRLVIDL